VERGEKLGSGGFLDPSFLAPFEGRVQRKIPTTPATSADSIRESPSRSPIASSIPYRPPIYPGNVFAVLGVVPVVHINQSEAEPAFPFHFEVVPVDGRARLNCSTESTAGLIGPSGDRTVPSNRPVTGAHMLKIERPSEGHGRRCMYPQRARKSPQRARKSLSRIGPTTPELPWILRHPAIG
jgi:hypothetical protein